MKQTTSNLFLIRPFRFFSNPQTAINNFFQNPDSERNMSDVSEKALLEFDMFIDKLKRNDLNIFLFHAKETPMTPDAIFPNNWISTHQNGKIFLYPMFAENRRLERRQDIIDFLFKNFDVTRVFNNANYYENENQFLEGTGSMILDREHKIVYAALSERTNQNLLDKFCNKMNFSKIIFTAFKNVNEKKIIYHTNVMMSVCKHFVVICLDSIENDIQKNELLKSFKKTKKEIISISLEQVNNFCGNILEVVNKNGNSILIMSTRAYNAFSESQKKIINKFCKIVHSPLDTIEYYGGGGARCMLAEIFLNKI